MSVAYAVLLLKPAIRRSLCTVLNSGTSQVSPKAARATSLAIFLPLFSTLAPHLTTPLRTAAQVDPPTEYTQSDNFHFLVYSPLWRKNYPSLVRMAGGVPPPPLSLYPHHVQSCGVRWAERADIYTLLFLLYPYVYSVDPPMVFIKDTPLVGGKPPSLLRLFCDKCTGCKSTEHRAQRLEDRAWNLLVTGERLRMGSLFCITMEAWKGLPYRIFEPNCSAQATVVHCQL